MEERLQFLLFWIKENRYRILWGFSAVFVFVTVMFWKQRDAFSSSGSTHYLETKQLFSSWKQSPVSNMESYQSFKKAIHSSLALKETMSTDLLAYSLMHQELDGMQNLFRDILTRVGNGAKCHLDFTKTSLLMDQHQWEDALKEARSLQESLTNQAKGFSSILSPGRQLIAYNLFRIAFLEKQLSLYQQEQKTLGSLETLLKEMPDPMQLELPSRAYQGFSLMDYVSLRQQQLKEMLKASS